MEKHKILHKNTPSLFNILPSIRKQKRYQLTLGARRNNTQKLPMRQTRESKATKGVLTLTLTFFLRVTELLSK